MEGDNYKWCLHTRACAMGAVCVCECECECAGAYVGISLRSAKRTRKEGNGQSNFRTKALILSAWLVQL